MKLAIITLALMISSGILFEQNTTHEKSETGYLDEVSREINSSADRLLDLAGEIPEDLFDWRPGGDVRSVREVFAHIANANYSLPAMMGVEIPEGVEPQRFEERELSKDEIIELLEDSFDHLQSVIENVDEQELNEEISWFGGRSNTVRGVLLFIPKHIGEHQGQLIAYARINDIIPPWNQ